MGIFPDTNLLYICSLMLLLILKKQYKTTVPGKFLDDVIIRLDAINRFLFLSLKSNQRIHN